MQRRTVIFLVILSLITTGFGGVISYYEHQSESISVGINDPLSSLIR